MMNGENLSAQDWESFKSLRLAEFSEMELGWSFEVARRHINVAKQNGAGEACVEFWTYLALLFRDELRSRKRPM